MGHTQKEFWFKAKNDLTQSLMERVCGGKKGLKILNLGAGIGDDLEILNKFGASYVVDLDKEALSIIPDGLCVEKKLGDAQALPYEDDFFDVVISFNVFEHVKDDYKAVSEIYRVLKPSGVLVFMVPAFQCLFSSHDKALEHYRRYSRKDIKNLLSLFQHSTIFFWNSILFVPMAITRLIRKNSSPKVDQTNFPNWLNALFYYLLSVDRFFISQNMAMPFGLSLVGICRK